jgi:hypothetical protein
MNQFGCVAAYYPVLIGVCVVRGAEWEFHDGLLTETCRSVLM